MIKRHLVIAAAAAAVMAPALIVFDRSPPAEIISTEVRPNRVIAGECATVLYTARINRSCASHVEPRIYTSLNHVWPLAPFDSGGPHETGVKTFAYSMCLPWTILATDATYRQKMTFACRPFDDWWPIEMELPPVKFQIVESPTTRQLDVPKISSVPPAARP